MSNYNRLTPIPTPSSSNRSYRSNRSHVMSPSMVSDDSLFASKEKCHIKAEKTLEAWGDCIKMMLKYSNTHDEMQKTARAFVQADTHAKNTRQSLNKASKTLELLLDKKREILATTGTLKDIGQCLGESKNYMTV
ncbi:hypothetical protein J3Q64DRAFT_1695876 [Phycomyces blakesleeanus]|uniref:BLOC-1-related complex subunit 7 n=2 Tax=Phycomyces blakesleeanus TaxID=4837 RepID=A0A162V7V6_PHYB8|nr:hypothetical protein PHYBLDRAFT_161279 [Phycomyces blakesleeanus NRRL 1555(-)]OAD80642.1 hypothetical protein PHYBLDRAFT_161279 [Phycomyces blakesleeanus NRRL 1555(-)]|eukprot:XP_018298682.1 hypothetical protein PHYBLDRAFT_161279 [Phycomyces blakesleeanus NRRL 1555(-)]